MSNTSPFQLRKKDLVSIVIRIPPGSPSTLTMIGDYVDVQPRHIAYILSRLSESEQDTLPWYRVVGTTGQLAKQDVDIRGRKPGDFTSVC